MRDTYSLYEAKARLSAILRDVARGDRVTVTVRGRPVAQIVPLAPPAPGIGERLERLIERGIVVRVVGPRPPLRPVARRPGALKRFLAEREDG